MKSVAVFAVKGGVGKTSAAVCLAHVAASSGGRRTLLWDLDPQGAAGHILGIDRPGGRARAAFAGDADLADLCVPSAIPNLSVLPADRSLRRLEGDLAGGGRGKVARRLLRGLEGRFDRVVIDCPPGLTGLADRLFRAVDLLVVPVQPAPLSARALDQLAEHLHGSGPPLLPVWSAVDRRRAMHRAAMAAEPARPAIPYSAGVEAMADLRAPVTLSAPSGIAARAYAALWSDVERRLAE